MPKFEFDHVVHFLNQPEAFIHELSKQNIHAVEGGRHEGRGTYNALSYFDLSYIEYLGAYDQELVRQSNPAHHSMIETIIDQDFEESLVRFAVRTDDIQKAAAHFKEAGLTVTGPDAMFRKRPDGSEIHWQLLYIGEENNKLPLPFIIQWNQSDEERRNEQIQQGVIGQQLPNTALEGVVFVVENAEETAKRWGGYFKKPVGETYVDQTLQAKIVTIPLNGGKLHFAEPVGEGIIKNVLRTKGEVPFQINLKGFNEEKLFEAHNGRYLLKK